MSVRQTEPWIGESINPKWIAGPALLFAFLSILTLVALVSLDARRGPGVDFTSFWAAAHLALAGHAPLAYNYAAHRAAETGVASMHRAVPFPYPPPFLLVLMPFGFRPYWLAYLAWMTATGSVYLLATRRFLPTRYALGFPATLDNIAFGQNAFLTCSAFVAGASLLELHPILAGASLALFVCKPQLASLLPVVFVASRNWRAALSFLIFSLALLGIAVMVFGWESYAGFLAMGPRYTAMMARNEWPWNQVASVFGAARYFGAPVIGALLLQAAAALLAVIVTWRAWSLRLNERVPILAAATLLVSPYLFTYDSVLLVIAIGCFVRERKWIPVVALWLMSLASLLSLFGLCPTPNLTPVAAMVTLGWLHFHTLPNWRTGLLSLRRASA